MNSCEEDRQAAESVRILELFSGIGGWKYAADQTFQDIEYTCAYDIAPAANEVYRHNFGVDPCKISIEKLNTKKLAELNCNVWLLSPPCQPFTRSNTTESRDDADPRARPLLHLAKLLMNLGEKPAQFERQQNPTHTKKVQAYRPHWIALENVVGFEESNCCRHWLQALEDCGYHYLQFVLTPTQFGIPNERPRYYCLASLSPFVDQNTSPAIPNHKCILSSLPHNDHMAPTSIESIGKFLDFPSCTFGHLGKAKSKGEDADNGVVGKETHSAKSSSFNHSFLVPDETLKKSSGWCFDIVTSRSQRSACFTKSYSRYIKGTGSVLYLDECCGFENGGCGDVGTTSEPLTAAESGHRSNATVKMKGQKESAKTEGSTSYSEHRQHHCCQHCGSIRSSQKKSITGKRKQRASTSRNINISPGSENDEGDCPHNSHPISDTYKRKVGEEKENSTEDGEEREVYNHHEDEFLQLPEERSYEDGWQEKFYKKLRYFTPTEIARLLSFPVPAAGAEVGGGGGGGGPPARPQGGGGGPAGGARGGGTSFSFPAALGRRQRYALLGNSLSVAVAARLLRFLAARTAGPGAPRARARRRRPEEGAGAAGSSGPPAAAAHTGGRSSPA